MFCFVLFRSQGWGIRQAYKSTIPLSLYFNRSVLTETACPPVKRDVRRKEDGVIARLPVYGKSLSEEVLARTEIPKRWEEQKVQKNAIY